MDMSNQMPPNGPPQMPPGYMAQRFAPPGMMPGTPNGMAPVGPNGMRMPYPPMDMSKLFLCLIKFRKKSKTNTFGRF